MNNFLSKSDFKVARNCPTKLFYKKQHFPTTLDDDRYMEMLADGGFMVGKFAQLLYPEGIMVSELNPAKAVAETTELMQRNTVTIFEPAFLSDGFLARVDILKKEGNRLQLIEVKSKGFDAKEGFVGKRGTVISGWLEYIEDVAFQRLVLEKAFPSARVECFLLLPDKNAASEIDLLPTWFSIERNGRLVEVVFAGNETVIRQSKLLRLCPVDGPVEQVLPEVRVAAAELLSLVVSGLKKAPPIIGYRCRDCEFRVDDSQASNGFRECWGALAKVEPSILDLYQLGSIKTQAKERLADVLIKGSKVSLFDIPLDKLDSSYALRQKVQIQHTASGTEWRSDRLKQTLEELSYPLHFVDFETSRLVLPYHRGMKPFEQVAFQWSCHTIAERGGPISHREWINFDQSLPNVKFAESLQGAIGSTGTILTWSHHERTTLDDIARQISEYHLPEAGVRDWLLETTHSSRIFDLCAHAQANYFHPQMKGSNSIKAVLPAVWRASSELRENEWFKEHFRTLGSEILDPYDTLPKLGILQQAEVVKEGTGAMFAYQEMLYGKGKRDSAVKTAWRDLLLQYCKLDTLAMVIIWKHWLS